MKSVHELNADELDELRTNYFCELLDTDQEALDGDYLYVVNEDISCPEDIPMDRVIAQHEHISFVDEDFWCNLEQEEEGSVIEKLNLDEVQVLRIVKEWYTNGMCADIFQNEDGIDLEEFLETYLY